MSELNVTVIDHPLVRHKLSLMREKDCSTYKFRTLTKELARLMAYEASRDFEIETFAMQGWCGEIEGEQIVGKTVTVVPILRAGLGMLDGVLDLIPTAKSRWSACNEMRKPCNLCHSLKNWLTTCIVALR